MSEFKFNLPNPCQPFPVDALPPRIKNAVQEVQANIQAPLPLIVSAALGAISLACQNSVDVRRPIEGVSPCSLFLLTIAASGEGKTPVIKEFMKPIEDFQNGEKEKSRLQSSQYEAKQSVWEIEYKEILAEIRRNKKKGIPNDQLEKDLADHLSKKPQNRRTVKLIYQNTGPEAILFGLYKDWPSGGLMSNEAGTIFQSRAMNDLPMLNQLWDDGTADVTRKTSESFTLDDCRLTISLMAQEKRVYKFTKHQDENARDSGFLARCLVAFPESTQTTKSILGKAPSVDHVPAFQQRITEILAQNRLAVDQGLHTRRILNFSNETDPLWTDIRKFVKDNIQPGRYLSDVGDYAAKFGGNVARVAALFHYFEEIPGDISYDTLLKAVNVCDWYLNEFRRVFPPSTELSIEQKVQLLEQCLIDDIFLKGYLLCKRNALHYYGPSQLRPEAQLKPVLDYLEIHGRIRLFKMDPKAPNVMSQKAPIWIELNRAYFNDLVNLQRQQDPRIDNFMPKLGYNGW